MSDSPATVSNLAVAPGATNELLSKLPLSQRIGRTEPSRFRTATGPHAGAGSMEYGPLLEANAVSANLLFVHRGVIAPFSGIGQHFHNQCEEMFVILDGEAQFTIDGRTSTIKGPAGVPCCMGHSHAIYNATDKPLQWLNINVGMSKAYDAFDLGDPRADMALDPVPQFASFRLDQALLKPRQKRSVGKGIVQYRRMLQPVIFSTTWAYVDHILVPSGTTLGSQAQDDLCEVYFVVSGNGAITVDDHVMLIQADDAVPIDFGQEHSLQARDEPLELMVIGVAKDMAIKALFMAAEHKSQR